MARILGLDIGMRRTGVALSDADGWLASPFCVFEADQRHLWFNKVKEIIDENEVEKIVVGLPLDSEGEVGSDAKRIREFVNMLRKRVDIPVIEWDERYTTVEAERSLIEADLSRAKRKKIVDKIAATIILQGYLDSLKPPQTLSEDDW